MTDKLEEIQILFQRRTATKRGPTSSDQLNDMMDEVAADLSSFDDQWNNRLVPLTGSLPDGTIDADVDAWANGLDGNSIYVDQSSTTSNNASYFNTPSSRPNTILEQFTDVYSAMTTLQNTLENQIAGTNILAADVPIADAGGLYDAANVEAALAEVMTDLNALAAIDFGAVPESIIPDTDNAYTIGTSSFRFSDIKLGPASVQIISKAADGGGHVDKTFKLSIDATDNKLKLYEDTTAIMEFNAAGVTVLGDFETPADTTGLTTSGLAVGYDGPAVDDQIRIGDNQFYLDYNAGTPVFNWDTNDYFFYNRGSNIGSIVVNTATVAYWSSTGIGIAVTPHEALTVNGVLSLGEGAAPSNTAGYGKIYVKSADSLLYFKDDSGTEYDLTAGTSSAGVSGAIQFADGAGAFISDDTNFHWDNSSKRLGIGTNGPSEALHILDGRMTIERDAIFADYTAACYQTGSPTYGGRVRLQRARGTKSSPSNIAVGDYLGSIDFHGWGGGGFGSAACRIVAEAENTWSSGLDKDAALVFFTQTGFSEIERMRIGAQGGVQVGTPTGGDKGSGTINVATDIYKNNTAYVNPDYVFEQAFTGQIVQFANNPGASEYQPMSISQVKQYAQENLRLPGISDEPMGMFDRTDKLLEKIEQLYLFVFEQQEEIKQLKQQVQTLGG